MAKMLQNNFSSGELSPVLSGRSDLAAYYKGVAEAENFVVTKEGTLRKRRGFSSRSLAPCDDDVYDQEWSGISAYNASFACCSESGYVVLFNSSGTAQRCYIDDGVAFRSVWYLNNTVIAVGLGDYLDLHNVPLCVISSDRGITWTKHAVANYATEGVGAATTVGDALFCEIKPINLPIKLMKSIDAGETWTEVSFESSPAASRISERVSTYETESGEGRILLYGSAKCIVIPPNGVPAIADANPAWTCAACRTDGAIIAARNGHFDVCTVSSDGSAITLHHTEDVAGDWKWIFKTSSSKHVAIGDGKYTVRTGYVTGSWSDVGTCSSFGHVSHGSTYIYACAGTARYRFSASSSSHNEYRFKNRITTFAVFPYKYDRTDGGFVVVRNQRVYFAGKDCVFKDWEGAKHDFHGVAYETLGDEYEGGVGDMQCKQIGDQLWISNGEWHGVVTVTDNARIAVSAWSKAGRPLEVPCVAGTSYVTNATKAVVDVHSTSSTQTYKTATYGCCGVKDSVNSFMNTVDVQLSVTWEAGNYVDIFVTVLKADIDKYDSIIVGKKSGSSIGILGQFYMTDEPYVCKDTNNATCYRHDDGKYYTARTGGTEVTLSYVVFRFRDENHTPSEMVYDQTDTLGVGFDNPMCVDCYQQRRVFANAETEEDKLPMTLWFSEIGNIDNFWANRPVGASDPFSPTISTTGPAFIRFIMTWGESLVMFTDAGVFTIGFAQTSGGFSSSTCRIAKISDAVTCDGIQPILTEAGVFFVGADRKTVFTVGMGQNGSPSVVNRSVLVEHLTRTSPIVAMAHQRYPDNVMWFATGDGRLLSLTFNAEQEVWSWAHSVIDGAYVRDVVGIGTCTDYTDGRTSSDIVLVIERDGVRYMCSLNDGYADAIGGTSSNVVAKMTTMRPESQQQTIVGMRKNVKDLVFRLYESGKVKVRPAEGAGPVQELALCSTRNAAGYTGDAKVMPRGYVNDDGQVTVVSDDGNPCEILSVATELEVA